MQPARLADVAGAEWRLHSGENSAGIKPSADAPCGGRENLVHVLLNHNDFVTIR